MSVPLHSRTRKRLRHAANKLLAEVFGREVLCNKIDPAEVKRLLIIRINYRIGNALFLTPLIRELEKTSPGSNIDLLVGSKHAKDIFQMMPQVTSVYTAPRAHLRRPWALFSTIRQLRRKNYDAIVLPVFGSMTSNLATLLIKAKYKIGFIEANSWVPLSHPVPAAGDISHEALKPLQLLSIFNGTATVERAQLDIELSARELRQGNESLSKMLLEHSTAEGQNFVVGIFRDAKSTKKISDEWWVAFVERLRERKKAVLVVDILEPGVGIPLTEADLSISDPDLRKLAGILSCLNGFVSADTGPMHLASAAGVPVLALFNSTDPKKYGPLGDRDLVVQINGNEVETIVDAAMRVFFPDRCRFAKQNRPTMRHLEKLILLPLVALGLTACFC